MSQSETDKPEAATPMLDDYSGVERRGGMNPSLALHIFIFLIVTVVVLWRIFGY